MSSPESSAPARPARSSSLSLVMRPCFLFFFLSNRQEGDADWSDARLLEAGRAAREKADAGGGGGLTCDG